MILSNLEFGSYLTYTPRGNTELTKKSKNIMICLKNDSNLSKPQKIMSQFVTEKIKENIGKLPFNGFFSKDTALVPVPKSSLMQSNTLWVPDRLAKAMSDNGLGRYYPCLDRATPLRKASSSQSSERPTAIEHFDSIGCKMLFPKPKEILLIDDVITRGATMIGCASRLKSLFHDVPIKAFAIIRTISNPDEFKKIEYPCIGNISHSRNGTFREP